MKALVKSYKITSQYYFLYSGGTQHPYYLDISQYYSVRMREALITYGTFQCNCVTTDKTQMPSHVGLINQGSLTTQSHILSVTKMTCSSYRTDL